MHHNFQFMKKIFFIVNKYSPLSGAKKFIKIINNESEEIILPQTLARFLLILIQI